MHAPLDSEPPQPGSPVPARRQVLSALAVIAFTMLLGWIIHARSAPPAVAEVNQQPPTAAP
jgi:hypothetical protein